MPAQGFLQGCLFSFSTNCEGGAQPNQVGERETFGNFQKLVEDNGGKISRTIHKRVKYLIASEGSVSKRTQRVRKAVKHKIPILKPGFLQEYVSSGKLPNLTPYLYETSDIQKVEEKKKEKNTQEKKQTDTVSTQILDLEKVWTDCYCACHDDDKPYCEWCTEGHPDLAPWPLVNSEDIVLSGPGSVPIPLHDSQNFKTSFQNEILEDNVNENKQKRKRNDVREVQRKWRTIPILSTRHISLKAHRMRLVFPCCNDF
eukprot:m.340786 g.340786  ORF g.340786 m.340786 type:complete len:257 (+) comp19530_c0_seq1:166-936(+)